MSSLMHTVEQGECLSSIARSYGFAGWRTIYEHPTNADFRQLRPNPNLIYPGDRLFIPTREPPAVSRSTEQRHRFRLRSPRTLLRLLVEDADGQALSGKRYQLRITGGATHEGTTGEDGLIEAVIQPNAGDAELVLKLDENPSPGEYSLRLKIGHLDPVEEITGVQARLQNLAFYGGDVDGTMSEETRVSLKAFQSKFLAASGYEPAGELDDRTRSKISELHDGI